MGAAASAGTWPEKLDKAALLAMVGEKLFDLRTYNEMCDADGLVLRDDILKMSEDDEEDFKQVAATVERDGIFFSFEAFDDDSSGGLTYEEFGQAAKSLGFHILPANLDEECRKIDTDLSGIIDEEEFVRFVQSRHAVAPQLPAGLDPKLPGVIFDHLGNMGAQHAYSAALAILKARPTCATDKLSGEGYKGSAWLPLHYILMQNCGSSDAGLVAAKARRLIAEPLVLAILKAYVPAASQRCMEGVRYPRGHLPLELAIARGWSLAVIEGLVAAFPEALRTLDATTVKIQERLESKEPMTSLKGLRNMRQMAEAAGASHEILCLLPKPKMVEGKVEWKEGQSIADEAAEKLRKKTEKEAKKAAKLAAKKKKEADKRAKADAQQAKAGTLLVEAETAAEPPAAAPAVDAAAPAVDAAA